MARMTMTILLALLQASPEPAQQSHAPGARVPAQFTLDKRKPTGGGRTTAIYDHYPPEVSFDGGPRVKCKFFPGRGGMAPGETQRIEFACDTPTRTGQSFKVFERGRPVGGGMVLTRD